ncbi:MAG: putative zinc-binding metallopeptidase [Tenacibaculum sp.]
MKYTIAVYTLFLMLVVACKDEPALEESIFDTNPPELSELDIWLRSNYTIPYNIEVLYLWDDNEVEQGSFLFPPEESRVKPLMKAIKLVWIDPYTQLGGDDFIKKTAPRQIVLVGSYNVNSNGSVTLGTADSGLKITLFRINYLDLKDIKLVKRLLKTVQHEYCHILNQTKPFSPKFQTITPSKYDGSWTNYSLKEALEDGFITQYARSSPSDDFAELTSTILTNSKEDYEAIISGISGEDAKKAIRAKESIISEYFSSAWNIDLYQLQALSHKKLEELTQ